MVNNKQLNEPELTARLKELLGEIFAQIQGVSKHRKQSLLTLLEDWQYYDRRKRLRKAHSIQVAYSTQDRTFKDFVRNISIDGAFVQTPMRVPVGEQISLSFPIPNNGGYFRLNGEMVWSSARGGGVKFTSTSMRLKEMIQSL